MAQNQVVAPVIVKTKRGRYMDVAQDIRPFVERTRDMLPSLIPRLGAPETAPFTPYPMKVIPRFNMVASLLPREIIYALAERRDVEKVFPDAIVRTLAYSAYPTVPAEGVFTAPHRVTREITFTSSYWVKRAVGADVANAKGFTGRGILACTIDTGCSRVHEQTRRVIFETTIIPQHRDENGHGTHVTSLIGGISGVDSYLSQRAGRTVVCEGMAPECGLLAVKSLGYVIGLGSTSNIIEALDISVQHGADVINMSLGGPSDTNTPQDDPYYDVFDEIVKYNVIPLVAAGNSGPEPGTVESPGAMPNCLTVGAYDPVKGEMADFSSRGPTRWGDVKPDVVAPGVNIDSATEGVCDTAGDGVPSRYSPLSGTSMATPVAAGLVALMRQCHRDVLGKMLTLAEVKEMMKQLGHAKTNTDGWGPITFQLYERWLSTQYGVEL